MSSSFRPNVLNLKRNEIVAVPRTSTVLFMDNVELDYLLDNIYRSANVGHHRDYGPCL